MSAYIKQENCISKYASKMKKLRAEVHLAQAAQQKPHIATQGRRSRDLPNSE